MELQGRDLYLRMKGEDVQVLHTELRQLGFDIRAEEIERNFFGRDTRKAVLEFQRSHGLPTAGVVDVTTAKMVNEMLGALQPPPQRFVVRGVVRLQDGSPVPGVIVRAFDKDLRREELLGEAITDERGFYEIAYTADQFRRAEKKTADLLVRAFGPDGRKLGESEILFNAPPVVVVDLDVVLPEEPRLSEYERLRADLAPVLEAVPPAELTSEDVTFLVEETERDRKRIEFLAQGARLSRETSLPTEAFYGFARQGLRQDLEILLAQPPEVLLKALKAAIEANIIPDRLGESLDRIMRRLEQLRVERGLLVTRRVVGQLRDQETGKPLAGFTVRALDLGADPEPKDLAPAITDGRGLFRLAYTAPREAPPEEGERRFLLHIIDREGDEIPQVEIAFKPDEARVVEVSVAVPEPPSPSLTEFADPLELPQELLSHLEEHGITTLADIRRAGGLGRLGDLPVALDDEAVRKLEAHANLSTISPDTDVNTYLIDKEYTSVFAIANTPRADFVRTVHEHEEVGDFMAARMHVDARARTAFLNNIVAGVRAEQANGAPPLGDLALKTASDLSEVYPPKCGCKDCEAAVSPLAYLADLLDFAVTHLKDDGTPIDLEYLSDNFHQLFGDLPASCEELDRQVRQVRICIEVLRSYLGSRPLSDTDKEYDLSGAEEEYRIQAYTTLLNKIGTSYEELRLARHADEETRQRLADRLGIGLNHLRALLLDPENESVELEPLTEEALERLFGLVDTNRDPLSEGAKLGDRREQITRWNLNGVEWNINTDRNGIVYVKLKKMAPDDFRVEVYRDHERTELVASGGRNTKQGTVDLWEENKSRLWGTFVIDHKSNTDDIEISVIPDFLSWQMQHLRTLWKEGDWPPDPYTESAKDPLPMMDPDVAGPDDIRQPFAKEAASDPDGPFDISIRRRDWVDTQLRELQDSPDFRKADGTPDLDAMLGAVYESVGYEAEEVIPWADAPPVGDFKMLSQTLTQGGDVDAVQDRIRTDLKLTVESFTRLMEIKAAYDAGEKVREDQWDEVYSILVQAQKVSLFSIWREEEELLEGQMGEVLFGPKHFWVPLRQPTEGDWPPLYFRRRLLIDPEIRAAKDLPKPRAGNPSLVVWQAREAALARIYHELKSEREANGFEDMLQLALGDTLPNLDALNNDLASDNAAVRDEAIRRITTDLYMTVEDFAHLMETKAKNEDPDPDKRPMEKEWAELYGILTSAQKKRVEYPEWIQKEAEMPVIDPNVLEREDLAETTAGRRANELWQARQEALEQTLEELMVEREANGFEAMLLLALGDPLPHNPDTLNNNLASDDVMAVIDTKRLITTDLHLTVEDFARLMEIKAKHDADDPESKPSKEEWAQVYAILTQAKTLRTEYQNWADEEDLEYWRIFKARLPRWRATAEARQEWLRALDSRSDPPHIDPDSIGPGHLRDPVEDDPAYDLWEDRHQWVEDQLTALTAATTLAELDVNLESALGVSPTELEELAEEREDGTDITGRLDQLSLTNDAFSYLLRFRELLVAGEPVLESEWDNVYNILVHVHKCREFADWREQERKQSIILGPDHFQIPERPLLEFPPKEPEPLPAWRATEAARRDWLGTLQSRIDQEQAVVRALQEVVSATEEATLAMLRDALVMATDAEGNDLEAKAKSITDLLLIDAKVSGCQMTTRISQALETIQGLIFSVRTGQLRDTYPALTLDADCFDQIWKWLGSYATWRAAMFVFLYPENVLLPQLREWQTPAFRQLVRELRDNRRLTPEQACEAAAKYADYFEDVCKLQLEASVQARTRTHEGECLTKAFKGDRYRVYLFARGEATNTVYVSWYDPGDESPHAQSFWQPVPGLENVIDIVGAAVYAAPLEERFIYLFARIKEKSQQKLVYVKYDLEQGGWSGEPNELGPPEEATAFTAVVKQRNREDEPPHLAIRVRSGAIYARPMNRDGTDWADEYWHPVIGHTEDWHPLIEWAKGRAFSKLCAMIESAPGEWYLFMLCHDGVLRYRLFGNWDDGRWRELYGWESDSPAPGSWLGGFPWPAAKHQVYTFWKYGDHTPVYQSIRRLAEDLKDSEYNNVEEFDENWLRPVAGVSLADPTLRDNTEYNGMNLLEFFTLEPGDDPHDFEDTVTWPGPGSDVVIETAAEKQDLFYNRHALAVIGWLVRGLETNEGPNWRSWKSADELIRHFAKPRRSLKEVLWQLLELKPEDEDVGGPPVRFKKREVADERSDCFADLPNLDGMDSIVYGSGEAPPDLTGRVAYRSTFGPHTYGEIAYQTDNPGSLIDQPSFGVPAARVGLHRAVYIQQPDRTLEESSRIQIAPTVPIQPAPTVTGLFDISGHLSESELQDRRFQIKNVFEVNTGAPSSVLAYLQEAWYFVPVHIALQLQRRRQFIAALDWFRTVYDYSVPAWRRNIYYGLELEKDLSDTLERSEDWLLDPLNPHAIAATRARTYTRFTILSLVRCFLEFADAEFIHDTAESLPRARTLYMTALELLDLPGLKQQLGACEDLIGRIDIGVGGSQWEAPIGSLLDDLAKISDYDTLSVLTTEVEGLLNLPDMSMAERLAMARARVRDELQKKKPLTFTTILEEKARALPQAHAALVSYDEIMNAAARVGVVAGGDFATGMALVTGDLLATESDLADSMLDLPWLREPVGIADTFTLAETEGLGSELPEAPGPLEAYDDREPMGRLKTVTNVPITFTPAVSYRFCVPPNPVLRALRLHAELNLYKLRNCRNIAGMEREISLYAAPTDVVSGLPTIGESGQLVVPATIAPPPTPYRYEVLIERAKHLADRAAQMEAAFLAALAQLDAEYYNLMKARQDVQLARAGVRLQDLRVREAEDGVRLAELQRERAETQVEHFAALVKADMIGLEQAAVAFMSTAVYLQTSAAALYGAGAVVDTLKAVFTFGLLGDAPGQAAQAASSLAAAASTTAQIFQFLASHERRMQDWTFQRDLARHDVLTASQHVRIAEDHVRVVGQERNIAEMHAEHGEVTADFLANKFTNVELYDWMSGVLEGVYSFFLQQATAMAKLAERQLAFERQQAPPSCIQAGYWEAPSDDAVTLSTDGNLPDRRGLTGSARLLGDIYKLGQYRFETEKRKLQLTKAISLARMAPIEFQGFRETGVMTFATPLELFDSEFPGHYLRLIKRVRTSVIALIPPTAGIRATLSTTGLSRVVIGSTGLFQRIQAYRPPESVALTSPRDATGLFELTPQPQEMLLPFEGLGVDTRWELRMPKAANPFDYNTIADVQITIEYMALDSYDYRAQVIQTLPTSLSADRPFSFRHQFADQWYDLHNPDQTATPMVVRFSTVTEDFPPNLERLKIQQVVLYFVRASGESFEVPVTHLHFTEEGGYGSVGGGATSNDGVISTRRGNAPSWMPMIGKSPIGEWELALPNTAATLFNNEAIEDILFVITYSGRTPEWPA